MSFLSNLLSNAGRVVVNNQPSNMFQIMQGESALRSYSPIDLVALNTNYVSICNGKNSSTCASIPLKLYYANPGKRIERTSYKSISKREQDRIAKGLRIQKAVEIVEIDEHPYLDLMANINPVMNGWDFTQLVMSYLGLIGNAYVRIEIVDGKPVALYPLVSEYVTVYASGTKDGTIQKYEYCLPNQEKKTFKPEEILHLKNIAPGNNILGRGELEQCVGVVELFNYAIAYEAYLSKNNARPDFAIAYKNALNEKDLKEITKLWFKKFAGVQNSGKPVVTSGEFDVKNLGFNPREMSYASMKDFCTTEISNAFGVNQAMLELNSANLASSLTAIQMYRIFTIYPKMAAYCQRLNEKILPMYDKNLYVWFHEEAMEDPNRVANVTQALQAGIMTVDEAREKLGMEPMGTIADLEAGTVPDKPTVTV